MLLAVGEEHDPAADTRGAAQRYQHIHDANEKAGSFYLQSKAYRAKEALERDLQQRAGGGQQQP